MEILRKAFIIKLKISINPQLALKTRKRQFDANELLEVCFWGTTRKGNKSLTGIYSHPFVLLTFLLALFI